MFPRAITATTAILILRMYLSPASVEAGFRGYSGAACNGTRFADVPCDGTCFGFVSSNSFIVDRDDFEHCVTMYTNTNCPSGAESFIFKTQHGQCTTVNTGTFIGSFRCAASNVCLD